MTTLSAEQYEALADSLDPAMSPNSIAALRAAASLARENAELRRTVTHTTPGAISAESWEQAVEEIPAGWSLARGEHPLRDWIKDRAREIESTRTPATQDAVAALKIKEWRRKYDRVKLDGHHCDATVLCDAILQSLSAAHHTRKPKEK